MGVVLGVVLELVVVLGVVMVVDTVVDTVVDSGVDSDSAVDAGAHMGNGGDMVGSAMLTAGNVVLFKPRRKIYSTRNKHEMK